MNWLEGEVYPGIVQQVSPLTGRRHGMSVRFEIRNDQAGALVDAYVPIARLAEFMLLLDATSIEQIKGRAAQLVFNAQGALVAIRRDGGTYQF